MLIAVSCQYLLLSIGPVCPLIVAVALVNATVPKSANGRTLPLRRRGLDDPLRRRPLRAPNTLERRRIALAGRIVRDRQRELSAGIAYAGGDRIPRRDRQRDIRGRLRIHLVPGVIRRACRW